MANPGAPAFFKGGLPGKQKGIDSMDLRVVAGNVVGEDLILTLSNNTTVTTSLSDVFTSGRISGFDFDISSNTLTVSQHNHSMSTVIPLGGSGGTSTDTFINDLTFDVNTLSLTASRSDGQGFSADLSVLMDTVIANTDFFVSTAQVIGNDATFTLNNGTVVQMDVTTLNNANLRMSDIDGVFITSDISFNRNKITGVNLPEDDFDVANKSYVDTLFATVPGDDNDALSGVISVSGDVVTFSATAIFQGATENAPGTAGIVPAPEAEHINDYLKGNGQWSEIREVPVIGEVGEVLTITGPDSYAWASGAAEGGGFQLSVDGFPTGTLDTMVFAQEVIIGGEIETYYIRGTRQGATPFSINASLNQGSSSVFTPISGSVILTVSAGSGALTGIVGSSPAGGDIVGSIVTWVDTDPYLAMGSYSFSADTTGTDSMDVASTASTSRSFSRFVPDFVQTTAPTDFATLTGPRSPSTSLTAPGNLTFFASTTDYGTHITAPVMGFPTDFPQEIVITSDPDEAGTTHIYYVYMITVDAGVSLNLS